MIRKILALLLSVFVVSACFSPQVFSQDDDLNVPGLTPEVGAETKANEGGDEVRDTSLLGLIKNGGWAMWLLGAFSFALVGLAVYCFLDFNPKNFYPTEEEEFLREKISRADLGAVIEKSNEKDAPTMAKMCAAIATHVNEYGYSADEAELHRDLIAEAGQKSNRHRARFVNYFAVIAQAAPMAGLLGTVSGMIKAFGKLGQGLDNPNVLASHISEALITTATGLVIALPAIFLYFHLRDKLESLVSESEDRANRMLGLLRQAALASTVYEEESLASRENAYRNGAADTE